MGSITDDAEYQIGGDEAISTFFGPHTANNAYATVAAQAALVRP